MRRQVRLWAAGQSHQVHAVLVQSDSVYAVSFIQPPQCDSCVQVFHIATIDSVQVRASDTNKTITAVVLSLPVIFFAIRLSQIPRT
jgi:hypothetical protein